MIFRPGENWNDTRHDALPPGGRTSYPLSRYLRWALWGFPRAVVQGYLIPAGYGVAWFDYRRGCGIAFPVPLNWLAWAIRLAWWRARLAPGNLSLVEAAYLRGFREGHAQAQDPFLEVDEPFLEKAQGRPRVGRPPLRVNPRP